MRVAGSQRTNTYHAQATEQSIIATARAGRRVPPQLNCRQDIAFIDRYLAGDLEPQLVHAFEAHLQACPDCAAFLATYRKTVEVTRAFLKLQSLK